MSAQMTVQAYFDAFNRRDQKAVAALFAHSSTYADRAVSSGVQGKSLEGYL
jgi:ketosteroid isomerase-like protein